MAYSRKRPTGGYGVSVFEKPTKATFEAAVEEAGYEYTVERRNVGEWNENREFRVCGEVVEVAMKGTTPNWAAMVASVRNMASGRW